MESTSNALGICQAGAELHIWTVWGLCDRVSGVFELLEKPNEVGKLAELGMKASNLFNRNESRSQFEQTYLLKL
jgi:hypothetical protein